jgi:PIN domain nuclease of toxin-antitoxin system
LKYLLDTHTLLWIVNDESILTRRVKSLYLDQSNTILLSMASVWEMAIKLNLKKLQHLPHYHKDPFDRLIAAQALAERLPVISADSVFDQYSLKRIWK